MSECAWRAAEGCGCTAQAVRACVSSNVVIQGVCITETDARVIAFAVATCARGTRGAHGDGRDTNHAFTIGTVGAVGLGGTQHGTRAYKLSINPPPRYALA